LKTPIPCSLFGAAIGWFWSFAAAYMAEINVRVRPELLRLEWYEAIWSGHYFDWLMIKAPVTGITVCIVSFAIIGFIFGVWVDSL